MRFGTALRGIIYKADLFSSGSLLRVKGQPEHQTLLGGFISISVMMLLIAVFYNKIIDTFDKVIITSTASNGNANDPVAFNLSTIGNGRFMFGVEVLSYDLNTGPRYFDVTLAHSISVYGEEKNTTSNITLQPCTKAHWEGYPEIQAKLDQIGMEYWKCLPKNVDFEIKGKYSSKESKTLTVSLEKCTDSSDPARPCAPQSQIDSYFTDNPVNYFSIYYINPMINPDEEQYLQYYLQDINYILFSQNNGAEALIYVEDYTIQTDESILPNTMARIQAGGVVRDSAVKNSFASVSDTYGMFIFFKSATSSNITRSFLKLDDVFSYIGGLLGTILMLFFLLGTYNTFKFEVNLAGYLYRSERKEERVEKSYNFIYFIGHGFYTFLRLLKLKPKWERLCEYYETREEMLKQLDILYLIKRVNFLERSLSLLFTPQQFKGLHLTSQLTMEDAVKIRKTYKLKSKVKREIESLQNLEDQNMKEDKIIYHNNSNHNFSFDAIQFKKADSLNGSQRGLGPNTTNYHFDEDNYSSNDSSSQQDETPVLDQICSLKKDDRNKLNKQI